MNKQPFTVIGSIGLQGIRLVNPTLGETVVVVGLGLIGLITAQLLKANGCNVIGFDFDQSKVDFAKSYGIDAVNPGKGVKQVEYVLEKTNQVGCDAVIITASNPSNEIISQSAQMSRKRGRIVLVGVIGLTSSAQISTRKNCRSKYLVLMALVVMILAMKKVVTTIHCHTFVGQRNATLKLC